MAAIAKKTDPALWERIKTDVTAGEKGGKAGQWSARKAQLATAEYKKQGGGYAGGRGADNHLDGWTKEKWGTRSGEKSGDTGERYLPQEARESLSRAEYDRTTAKKRADTAKGRQMSKQPADIARKTAHHRDAGRSEEHGELAGLSRDALMRKAAAGGVRGRSRMNKAALVKALS